MKATLAIIITTNLLLLDHVIAFHTIGRHKSVFSMQKSILMQAADDTTKQVLNKYSRTITEPPSQGSILLNDSIRFC